MGANCYNKWSTMHKIIETISLIAAAGSVSAMVQVALLKLKRIEVSGLFMQVAQRIAESACIGAAVCFDNDALDAKQQCSSMTCRRHPAFDATHSG